MTLWVIRSGKFGQHEALALDRGLAVIGGEEMPSLAPFKTRESLNAALQATYPDASPKAIANWEGQLWSFAQVIQKNDFVVMPLKTRSSIAIGRVSGDDAYRNDAATALLCRSTS